MEGTNTPQQTVIDAQAQYVSPVVRVMSEAEILSAFQVNAAGTMGWWVA
jgi:hypothetical protein